MVTAFLMNGWIWPNGVASVVEGLPSTGLPRLVLQKQDFGVLLSMSLFYNCKQLLIEVDEQYALIF